MRTAKGKGLYIYMLPFVLMAAFFVFLRITALDVYAATIGSITVDGRKTNYSDFEDLVEDLDDYDGKTITVDMLADWDAYIDEDSYDRRMVIPSGSTVTLNMHGHIFNRNNVGNGLESSINGELIYVEPGATLTVNGHSTPEEAQTVHTGVRIFTDNDNEMATGIVTLKGGALTGGNGNCGTGGIFVDSGKDVVLNDVTIAGCKASYDFFYSEFHSGYGGGAIITEDYSHLYLNDSTITGCLAQCDGGGVYADNDLFAETHHAIDLNNGHIDRNYADSDGGGVNMDGENVKINGKNGSTISCNKTHGYGGGVYFWNDYAVLNGESQGLVIEGNSAETGGGVYLEEENQTVSGVIIRNNYADTGGGIYVNNDRTTLSNCQITGNSGYGAYYVQSAQIDLKIGGALKIWDNHPGNLSLADESNQFTISPDDEMDIHIGYRKNPTDDDGYQIAKDITVDYSDKFTADDPGYDVVYNYRDKKQDDGRRLRYIRKDKEGGDHGRHRVNPVQKRLRTQEAHGYAEENYVYAGGYTANEAPNRVRGGDTYQLRKFYAHEDRYDALTYYSDGYFYDDPIIYNDHIATASYGMAMAGCYLDSYSYDYKHASARQFMSDIGCPDQMIYVNNSNTGVPGTDTIGVTIGSKHLQKYNGSTFDPKLVDTGDVLIAVAVRGANYEKEWASNVTLGDGSTRDGEAQGFSEAADQAVNAVEYYIDRYGLRDEVKAGKVRFWISGFSRAGATSNITAKRLIEEYCSGTGGATKNNKMFAYPLEAPKGGTDAAEKLGDKTKYYSIHNLINTGDVVPYVGPEEMGFKRYGIDHYIPGTYNGIAATESDYLNKVKSETYTPPKGGAGVNVTTYHDNTPLDTKKDMSSTETPSYKEYADRRDNMVRHLAAINHQMRYTDYFYPYGTALDWPLWQKTGKFDGAMLGNYLPNLVGFLQQEGFSKNDFRGNYVQKLQPVARAYMADGADEEGKKRVDALIDAIDKIISNADILDDEQLILMLGNYYKYDEEDHREFLQHFWDIADKAGAFNDLTPSEYEVVKNSWFEIMDVAFNFTDGDWQLGDHGQGDPPYPKGSQTAWVNGSIGAASGKSNSLLEDKLIYTLSMYMFYEMIIDMNHSRDIGAAWTRTYDSYYSKDTETGEMKDGTYTEYKLTWVNTKNPYDYHVDAPKAFVKNTDSGTSGTEPYKELREASKYPDSKWNDLRSTEKILLEAGRIHEGVSPADQDQGANNDYLGETVYYDLYDVSAGEGEGKEILVKSEVYRGGVTLPMLGGGTLYKIVTHARSLGKESGTSVYYIKLKEERHKVILVDGDTTTERYYEIGEPVTIASASAPSGSQYIHWKVTLRDMNGENVEDITSILLGDQQIESTAEFTMPASGAAYAEGRKYPAGFQLLIEARNMNRITEISRTLEQVAAITPVEGRTPPAGTALTFTAGSAGTVSDTTVYPISWTYSNVDPEFPASVGDFWIAEINVPVDADKGIVFAPDVRGKISDNPDNFPRLKAERDGDDGSATVTITVHGYKPDTLINLTVQGKDKNGQAISGVASSCQIPAAGGEAKETITWLRPPEAPDGWIFEKWDLNTTESKIELEEGSSLTDKTIKVKIPEEVYGVQNSISAFYQQLPSLTEAHVRLAQPVGGEVLQLNATDASGKETVIVKINGTDHVVDPDTVKIDWLPSARIGGDKAEYLVAYNAKVSFAYADSGGRYVTAKPLEGTGEYNKIYFDYPLDVTTTMNDARAHLIRDYRQDTDHPSIVSYTFPRTGYKLVKVYTPEVVTGVDYGTPVDEIQARLPAVDMLLDNGRVVSAMPAWGVPEKPLDGLDIYSAHIWQTTGSLINHLPEGVSDPDGLADKPVPGKVQVNAADSVKRAVPTVESGAYMNDPRLALISETEGAEVYYTTDTNPYIPRTSQELAEVKNHPEWHKYGELLIPINRANATEDEIGPDGKPTGRKQITLRVVTLGNNLRPDGVRTYVYVFINEVKVPQGQDSIYNGNPHLGVRGSALYTLEPISEGVTLDREGNAVATKPGTYKVRAKIKDGFRWEIVDPETGAITYTTEDQIITFRISTGYKITYKLNGGTLNGKTGTVTETYANDTVIKLPKPTRRGYTFTYWEGSKYMAGQEYKVTGDHTFTAQWKRGGPDTGDDRYLLSWIALMTGSLLLLAEMVVLRRLRSKRRIC